MSGVQGAGEVSQGVPGTPRTFLPAGPDVVAAEAALPVVATDLVEEAVAEVDFDALDRETALSALFDAHAPELIRLAALLGAGAESEDVVAEAFYRVHRRWGKLRDTAAALPYLRATVCNLARQGYRHQQVVRRYEDQVRLVEMSAESEAVLREDQREVVAALDVLPLRQRQVVILRYWLDLRECDVAEVLGISVGAVKSHASRAMASLARELGRSR